MAFEDSSSPSEGQSSDSLPLAARWGHVAKQRDDEGEYEMHGLPGISWAAAVRRGAPPQRSVRPPAVSAAARATPTALSLTASAADAKSSHASAPPSHGARRHRAAPVEGDGAAPDAAGAVPSSSGSSEQSQGHDGSDDEGGSGSGGRGASSGEAQPSSSRSGGDSDSDDDKPLCKSLESRQRSGGGGSSSSGGCKQAAPLKRSRESGSGGGSSTGKGSGSGDIGTTSSSSDSDSNSNSSGSDSSGSESGSDDEGEDGEDEGEDEGEGEGGEGGGKRAGGRAKKPPRKRRRTFFPRILKNERCGHCHTCLNPRMKKACLTRREEMAQELERHQAKEARREERRAAKRQRAGERGEDNLTAPPQPAPSKPASSKAAAAPSAVAAERKRKPTAAPAAPPASQTVYIDILAPMIDNSGALKPAGVPALAASLPRFPTPRSRELVAILLERTRAPELAAFMAAGGPDVLARWINDAKPAAAEGAKDAASLLKSVLAAVARFPVSMAFLKSSPLTKAVGGLRKHTNADVARAAQACVDSLFKRASDAGGGGSAAAAAAGGSANGGAKAAADGRKGTATEEQVVQLAGGGVGGLAWLLAARSYVLWRQALRAGLDMCIARVYARHRRHAGARLWRHPASTGSSAAQGKPRASNAAASQDVSRKASFCVPSRPWHSCGGLAQQFRAWNAEGPLMLQLDCIGHCVPATRGNNRGGAPIG
jgi:hypothetical protein